MTPNKNADSFDPLYIWDSLVDVRKRFNSQKYVIQQFVLYPLDLLTSQGSFFLVGESPDNTVQNVGHIVSEGGMTMKLNARHNSGFEGLFQVR